MIGAQELLVARPFCVCLDLVRDQAVPDLQDRCEPPWAVRSRTGQQGQASLAALGGRAPGQSPGSPDRKGTSRSRRSFQPKNTHTRLASSGSLKTWEPAHPYCFLFSAPFVEEVFKNRSKSATLAMVTIMSPPSGEPLQGRMHEIVPAVRGVRRTSDRRALETPGGRPRR